MGTAPPNVFGPFRVLHQVGAGALGPVFRAYDPDQDRLVAIKLFRLDLAPDRVHRLVAELETIVAARLTHPAIAQLIVAGIEGVEAYLAQEYVSAESLDTVVREQGSVRYTDAVRIGAQLADALDVAAASGLLHGALHPRDVLLSPDQARLTGLGVVAALEAVGAVAPIRRPYTAPERVAGAAWNRSADVFGLAALMHELLWGRRVAAMGREAARSLTEIADGDLQHLQTVFARALAENPDERFATATQFADALANGFSRRSSVASQQWAVGSSEPMVASHQAPAASHQVLEPRLPLEDEVVVSSPAFELEPPIEAVVDRFTDVDGTPESPISSRQSAVGSQQPAVGSLESIETSYQEPATGLRSSSFGQARRSAEGEAAASHQPSIEKIDLGEAWTEMTGLPFVWAFWAGRPDALTRDDIRALGEARNAGVRQSDAIARAYFRDAPAHQELGARYLRDNIKYHLRDEERAGLEAFYRYAREAGAAPAAHELRFY